MMENAVSIATSTPLKLPQYILFVCLTFLACTTTKIEEADRIVRKSIEYHGGMENFEALDSFRYTKHTILYKEDGAIEYDRLENHTYHLPSNNLKIQWVVDSTQYIRSWNGSKASEKIGEINTRDTNRLQSAENSLMSATYVLFQPFKLFDQGVTLSYEGEITLGSGERVYSIKAGYNSEDHTKPDKWWYYFDVNTYRYVAALVHTSDHWSYIKNISQQKYKGLLLHSDRISYRSNADREILYTRAEYEYRYDN